MHIFNYMYQQRGNIQIHTVGCDICIYDARQFANTLDDTKPSIVFNTCSVFDIRETECKLLTELLSKAFPNHGMYVLGCDVENNKGNYNSTRYKVYDNTDVANAINHKFSIDTTTADEDLLYIKIQDGCSHKCTFCIINQLRSNPYSVPYKEVVHSIREQIKGRTKPRIELAGTELTTYYDKETGYKISDLLEHLIEDIPEIHRITLTSLDPQPKETEELIHVISRHRDKCVQHLTLAVQSGSDKILKAMGRRHNVDRVRYLHHIADKCDVSLGWDIIVGFPTETEEDFQETYNLMKELKPLTQTMFAFSPRKGTPAYDMPEQVPDCVKQQRLDKIENLMYNYSVKGIAGYNSYAEYTEADTKYLDLLRYKQQAAYLICNGIAENIYIDLTNIDEIAEALHNITPNTVIYAKYDVNKSLECDIIVNFLKEFLKNTPIIVEIPEDWSENIVDYERHYHCIVSFIGAEDG